MFNRVYIHVPFCIKKCNYCAFVSSTPQQDEIAEYPALLTRELQLHASATAPLVSVYFGGGTPSLLHPGQLAGLLRAITDQTGIRTDAEITLEVNPGSIGPLSLQEFRQAGINRISLGIQSFDNHFLGLLGRIHTAEQSRQAFRDTREAGFDNVSIDLIHSLPGQNLDQWRAELQQAIALCPEHISVYGLTIEENTPFALTYQSASPELADEDLSADMFELAHELLTASGFDHYEIANYARRGYRSEHNSGYWKRDGYLGLGVAAHSLLREEHGIRFSNPDNLAEYRSGVMSGQLAKKNEQYLTKNDAMEEYLFLGLRLAEGINTDAFEREFGRPLQSVYGAATTELLRLGLIIQDGATLRLTLRGMLLSNQVFEKFLL